MYTLETDFQEFVAAACQKVAPLWPLSHFVAVNPFLGYTQQSFESAAHEHQRVLEVAMLSDLKAYQQQFAAGEILEDDLTAVIGRLSEHVRSSLSDHGIQLEPAALIRLFDAAPQPEKPADDGDSFSAFVDSQTASDWKGMLREEAAKWCAAYDDDGQSSWKFPWQDGALYAGWRAAAQIDRNPELHGLPNFRAFVRQLPEDPHAFLQLALSELGIPEARVEPLCYRLLMTLPGWAGHLRYKDRERELRGDRGTCYRSYWPFCSPMSWPCTKSCKIMRIGLPLGILS